MTSAVDSLELSLQNKHNLISRSLWNFKIFKPEDDNQIESDHGGRKRTKREAISQESAAMFTAHLLQPIQLHDYCFDSFKSLQSINELSLWNVRSDEAVCGALEWLDDVVYQYTHASKMRSMVDLTLD